MKKPTELLEEGTSLLIGECKSWVCPVGQKLEEHVTLIEPMLDTQFAKSYFTQQCGPKNKQRVKMDLESIYGFQMTESEVRRELETDPEALKRFKEVDGTWKYWTLERCTPQQREKYFELMAKVRDSSLVWKISENEGLRYLEYNE